MNTHGPPKERPAVLGPGIQKLAKSFYRLENARQVNTYGPHELCAWQVVSGKFWVQTTEPEFSRKLEKRADARRVGVIGINHFRRTFELRGTWRKIRRVIDRYLVSAPDMFFGVLVPASASETLASIGTAAEGRKGVK